MKCPRCQRENQDNANFCTGCGLPLTQAVRANANNMPRSQSKGGAAVTALVKAVLYIICFFTVQTFIISFYASAMLINDASIYFMDSYEELYDKLYELLTANTIELSLISGLIALLLVSLFFTIRHKNIFDEAWINARHISVQSCLLFAVFGLAMNAFVSISLYILPIPQSLIEALDSQYGSIMGQKNIIVEILSIGVVTAIVEEVFFRGLSYTRLKRGFNKPAAIIISAIIFGLAHGQVLSIIYAALLGAVICVVDEKYETITAGMIVHCFFNCGNYILNAIESDFIIMAVYFFSIAVLIAAAYLMIGRKYGYRDGDDDRKADA